MDSAASSRLGSWRSSRPAASSMIVLLEVLRFVASVGVILYHYQHFVTYSGGAYEPSDMPLDSVFSWFYRHGGKGVQLFWLLSGTVFAHVYQASLISGGIGIVDFVRKRFARLYPLHLATLLLVAVLMFVARKTTGITSVVYHFNDVKHFLLNLVFAQYWGFQSGTSFNGPSWSVSIEMVAYAGFVAVLFLLRPLRAFFKEQIAFVFLWTLIVVVIIGGAPLEPDYVTQCVVLFFTGSALYSVWLAMPDPVVLVLCVGCAFDFTAGGPLTRILDRMDLPFGSMTLGALLALLALSRVVDEIRPIRRGAIRLGSMTYSMYLIHFPLQIVFIVWSERISTLDFLGIRVFLLFFALLACVSIISHDYFELPLKRLVLRVTSSNKEV